MRKYGSGVGRAARVGRMELSGKVALVTGGGSGIGRAVTRALADSGAAVCINWFGEHGDAAHALACQLARAMAYEADRAGYVTGATHTVKAV